MGGKKGYQSAQDTFRQFAWNLAGTLAGAKAGNKPVAKPAGKS